MHMEPIALLNGRLMPQSQATLALNDAGFVFGATVTDLCRTFRQVLYRWPEHLARFRQSGRATCIDAPYSDEQITDWANQLVTHNAAGRELILVLFATPGPIGYYLGEPGGAGDGPATFGMHTFPLPIERYRRLVEQGAALAISGVLHVPAECVDPRIKQRSRMHWWLAGLGDRRIWHVDQAILLDAAGNLTETASANFLIVRDGEVIAPPRKSILNGISLAVVEELCDRLSIGMDRRPIAPADAFAAEEAMLASTPYCLVGVRSIMTKPLPWPGTVMRRLIEAWSADVGIDIHGQFTASR
jgi:branched-chain amino acid aminotransferase